jgi:signal transduction histidine kinase
MAIFQRGASEIYLDGKLIHRLGVVSKDPDEEVLFNPNYTPYSFQLTNDRDHVLAIRYSFTKSNSYLNFLGIWGGNPALVIEVKKMDIAIRDLLYGKSIVTSRLVGKGVFLLFLALLHLFFYITYPVKRANLYYSLFTLSLSLGYSFEFIFRFMPREGQSFFILGLISSLFFAQFIIWGLLAIYSHARQKVGWFFWLVMFCVIIYIIMWRWPYGAAYYFSPVLILVGAADAIRVSRIAVRNNIKGIHLIFYGWLGYFIFFTFFFLFGYEILPRFTHDTAITLDLAIFCGAVTFSALLAVEYAQTNRSLQASLLEVEVQRLEAMKMQELDKTRSNFFANISHEFRTPLTLIIGVLEKLVQKGNSSSEQVEEYHLIQRNARRLLQLINQLLDLSKLEAGSLKVEKQAGELRSFLDRLAGSFASLFESKSIIFHYTLPDDALHVYFDPDKLEKVLSNLLYNAYKFTPRVET